MKSLIILLLAAMLPCSLFAQCMLDATSGSRIISASSSIANSYYPGTSSSAAGASSINIGAIDSRGNSTNLATGDLILIIQMQGADYNTTNTDSYGNGVAGGDASGYLTTNLRAGFYEYNSVASISGATITLNNPLINSYSARNFSVGAIQSFQVIRIPRDFDLIINIGSTITAPAWNGRTGGVVVLDAALGLTINGSINVAGLGFRGGGGIQMTGATAGNTNGNGTLTNTDYRWNSPQTIAANLSGGAKGEGISGTPIYTYATGAIATVIETVEGYTDGSLGRGATGNAGGGSTDGSPVGAGSQNQFNSGGGGGANGGSGGKGGSGWHGNAGNVTTYPSGGYGGDLFSERQPTQFIMGGGGGAGSANNSNAGNQYMSSGGCGGGIILIRATTFVGTGSLIADGANAVGVSGNGGNTDAAGGGGAGGTIIAITRINTTIGLSNITASAKGGNGGNMETYYDHGPGGGGGGGVIITNGTFASTNVNGGSNGFTRAGNTSNPITNAYGAVAGNPGIVITQSAAPQQIATLNAPVACNPLPIKLISFTGALNNGSATLLWSVSGAVNFKRFEIEYSNDGNLYSTAGNVIFNPQKMSYQFLHAINGSAKNYYRLKLVDNDGKFSYSNVLLISNDALYDRIRIFPQPANESINLRLHAARTQTSSVSIYNIAGVLVKQLKVQLAAGNNSIVVDHLSQLSSGTYSVAVLVDGLIQHARLIIRPR